MRENAVVGRRLLDLVEPHRMRGDLSALAQRLSESWSWECLVPLLEDDDGAVAEAAALAIGMIGEEAATPSVARLLHHDRLSVVETAEDAMWSIWFRACSPVATAVLYRIAQSIKSHEIENSVPMLTELIRAHPNFAEAYHQRAAAYSLQGAFVPALRDARRAFELSPYHFSALALQGHARTALGHYREALPIYRQVLTLHPRYEGIRSAMAEVRARISSVRI